MSEWLPIESAPKDGTQILGLRGNDARAVFWGEYYVGCWMTGRTLPTMNGEPETFNPTHWQPLPPPPAGG